MCLGDQQYAWDYVKILIYPRKTLARAARVPQTDIICFCALEYYLFLRNLCSVAYLISPQVIREYQIIILIVCKYINFCINICQY